MFIANPKQLKQMDKISLSQNLTKGLKRLSGNLSSPRYYYSEYEKDINKEDIIENVFDVVNAISNDFNGLKEKLTKAFMVLKENKVIYEYKFKLIKDSEIISATYKFYPNAYPDEEFQMLTVLK